MKNIRNGDSFYLSFATELYDRYVRLNITDRIYYDTFSDIRIWYEHCVRERGVPGLVEEEWFTRHLNMRLFRLGRLQFETEGDALHVHIPEGSPLLKKECDESFAQADRFFGREYKIYDCESWLLDPVLTQILPESSNILRFQQRFRITKVRYDIPQAEERIFGTVLENKEDYPEKSSLQRYAKKYLLAGGKIGMGYGVKRCAEDIMWMMR